MEDYHTQLLKPLWNLMDQHNREYSAIQDAVTHAGRLWQTLDQDKLCQEIKEEKEKAHQQCKDSKQPKWDNFQQNCQLEEQQGSQQDSWWDRPLQQDCNKLKTPKL